MATPRVVALWVVILVAVWQGMIGVLVKWSNWPPLSIVCGRCIVASVVLWSLVAYTRRTSKTVARPHGQDFDTLQKWTQRSGGLLLGAHWGLLFWAYRISPIGPVVVAVFTYPIMASLFEPLIFRERPAGRQLVSALLGTLGVGQMTWMQGSTAAPRADDASWGILLGLASAACFAIRGIQARSLMKKTNAVDLMAVQVTLAAILLAPSLGQVPAELFNARELLLVVVFGVAFTALPHTLMIWALSSMTFAASSIIGSLQALSGIVLSALLLNEESSWSVWLGAALVVVAVASESFGVWTKGKAAEESS